MTAVVALVDAMRAPSRNGLSGRRFFLLALAIAALGGFLVWRLLSLQVLDPARYVEHGENQRIRSATLAAQRGAIVDRNGVELAVSVPRLSITADPRLVIDPVATAEQVAAITGADPATLVRRLSRPESKFAFLARQLDDETAAAVIALELPGVYAEEEQSRVTPGGSDIARAILGRTNIDGAGISGLEMQFDSVLTGEEGRVVVERGLTRGDTGRAVTIPDGRYELVTPVEGQSLVLTLDRTTQFEVENLLRDHVALVAARSGTAIVTRPHTGEILAMATVVRRDDGSVVVSSENRSVTSIFEPGSISKPLAMGALIDSGRLQPTTTVEVTDEVDVYDVTFADAVRHENTVLTAAEVLETSSNVGTALLVEDISNAELHGYLADFGIGRHSQLVAANPARGIDTFPNQAAGRLHDPSEWTGVSKPFAAIGYGYSATPLQMLRAYNVFANDGVLIEPHLVAGIASSDGDFEILSPREQTRVLSDHAAQTVTSMMAGVVRNGTGQLASVPGYEIAGKTGTARIAQPGGGYEDENGHIHHYASFAGFLPAASPELSIIVVIEDPEGDPSGGRHAAPLFGEISNFALQHFRIPPAESILPGNG